MMKTLWALLSAEAIKVRRSAPLWLAIAAPALVVLLEILTLFARRQINQTNPTLLWRDFLSFGWILWLSLFTPALVGLQAICLANLEHSGRHWKQLFAVPVPRWAIFAVKMLFCGLLIAASFVLFAVASVAAVLLFSAVRGLHLAGSIPLAEVAMTCIRTYAACWLLIVVHTWISMRFPGFATPTGIGFTAMIIGLLLLNMSPQLFGWWYPWTLPLHARPRGLYDAGNSLAPALFGALAGLALVPLASWDLARRRENA